MTHSPNGPLRVGIGGPVITRTEYLEDAMSKRITDRNA